MRGSLVDLSEKLHIGEYAFDPATGELARTSPGRAERGQRLAPQPARLLALLASRRGEVVSHEEIRQVLWPDVRVDYERGLHFCVRQVREALGDSAERPQYVETLPRRGYRLIAEPPKSPQSVLQSATERRRWGGRRLAVIVLGLLALVMGWWWLDGEDAPAPATVRVAILPFRPPAELANGDDHGAIAEQILVTLDSRLGRQVELVGPTTTSVWEGGESSLRELAKRLEPGYLVHGRYLQESDRIRLLGELIRWPDGAHVWVEIFDPVPAAPEIAARVAAGVADYLETRRPDR